MDNNFFNEISDKKFIEDYYGRVAIHGGFGLIANNLKYALGDCKELLASLGNEISEDIFIFRDGVACRKDIYFDSGNNIDWKKIWKMHENESATVYLRGLQKYLPKIKEALRPFRSHFPDRIPFANIFISPSNSVALKAHFDPTEFFVFQISGEKHWYTWSAPSRHEGDAMMPEQMALYCEQLQESTRPNAIYKLKSGDVLYLPLYQVHAPKTTVEESIHVTVGLAHPELRNRVQKD